MNLFIPLQKVDEEKRLVYGTATAEEPDRAGEVCVYDWSKPNFEAWSADVKKASNGLSLGNIRGQHGDVAAGRVVDITFDDAGKKIDICTEIVDDNEWAKVVKGVYTGFSIGGGYGRTLKKGNLLHYEAKPNHIAIVDRPCLTKASFQMLKADGSSVTVDFAEVETEKTAVETPAEPLEKTIDPRFGGKLLAELAKAAEVADVPRETLTDAVAADTPVEDLAKAAADEEKKDDKEAAKSDAEEEKGYSAKTSDDDEKEEKGKVAKAADDKTAADKAKIAAAYATLVKYFGADQGADPAQGEMSDISQMLYGLQMLCGIKCAEEAEGMQESPQVAKLMQACALVAECIEMEAAELKAMHGGEMEEEMVEKALIPRYAGLLARRMAKAAPVTVTISAEQLEDLKKSFSPVAPADMTHVFTPDQAGELATEIGQGLAQTAGRIEDRLSKVEAQVGQKLDALMEKTDKIARGPAIQAPMRGVGLTPGGMVKSEAQLFKEMADGEPDPNTRARLEQKAAIALLKQGQGV